MEGPVRVRDVLAWMDLHAPFRFAASWDRCGLQVGDPDAEVRRILVALDPSSVTLAEAEARGCQCLVTHHPLIFRPLDAVRVDQFPGRLVVRALKGGIHCIAAHTNLDAAVGGINDLLVRLLGLESVEPLESEPALSGESRYGGMGRVGVLAQPGSLREMVARASKCLGHADVRAVGNPEKPVRRLALCSGSGGSLIETVIRTGADAYLTGDIKYHEAQRAIEADLGLIDVGHFASERIIVEPLADALKAWAAREQLPLEVCVARQEKEPFWFDR